MPLTDQQKNEIRNMLNNQASVKKVPSSDSFLRDLEEAAGVKKSSQPQEGFFSRLGGDLKKRGQSLAETWKQTGEGKINPLETGIQTVGTFAGGIGDVVGQSLVSAGRKAASYIPESIKEPVKNVGQKALQSPVGQAGLDVLKKGVDSYTEWAQNNPRAAKDLESIVNIASLFPVGKGAQAGQKLTSGALQQTGRLATKTIDTSKKVLSTVGKPGKNVAEYAVSQITGLSPETIETIIKNPQAITKAQMQGLQRITVAEKVKKAFDTRLEDLSEVGKEYQKIRESGQVVKLPSRMSIDAFGINKEVLSSPRTFLNNRFGIVFDNQGKIIRTSKNIPISKGDKAALEEFLDVYGDLNNLDSNEFLNARQALDKLASPGKEKTKVSEQIAAQMRKFYDNYGKSQIEGLAELDAKFAPEINLLKKLKSDFFDAEGNLKDTAINRIANITGKGKDLQLERLKKIIPDIEKEVKILKAIEDIEYASGRTVGAYMRGGLGAVGVLTGNLGAILGAIASTPKIIVPLLTKYGPTYVQGKKLINTIIQKIQQGIKLNSNEKGIVKKSIEKAGEALGGATTLGIENQAIELPNELSEFSKKQELY